MLAAAMSSDRSRAASNRSATRTRMRSERRAKNTNVSPFRENAFQKSVCDEKKDREKESVSGAPERKGGEWRTKQRQEQDHRSRECRRRRRQARFIVSGEGTAGVGAGAVGSGTERERVDILLLVGVEVVEESNDLLLAGPPRDLERRSP